MDDAGALRITVTGRDQPGITSELCGVIDEHGARILDMEQVVIGGHLLLGVLVSPGLDQEALVAALRDVGGGLGVEVDVTGTSARTPHRTRERQAVVVLGQPLRATALAAITRAIADAGANIDHIARLSRYPILSFELIVSGGDGRRLRADLAAASADARVDVAVQPVTLYRRAKRLVVLDVDSTLVQGEVIERLAERAGCLDEVEDITSRAMAGELDFEESLRARVALLEGLPATALDEIAADLPLMPGARTLIRTLRRLGYATAAVSGGFTRVTDALRRDLGLDHTHANELAIRDGVLTGELVGPIVDRAAKAELLQHFADEAGVPLAQTVAVGDGANDLDMIARAGLGIAFNAKPVVRDAADTAVSVPYLDAVLFLLGITREEIEAADAEDGTVTSAPAVPSPG